MNTSDLTKVECWNCHQENGVVYGGEAETGTRRCSSCGEIIAEAGIDSLTIPRNSDEAMEIAKRRGEVTLGQKIKRLLR